MAQLPNMVAKIKRIANTGLYGSPRNAGFMNEVSKDHFTNVSSPIKAVAFAKFYKNYNKQKTPVYQPIEKITIGPPLKKIVKAAGGKKKSPKPKSPDYKAMAKAAAKAKANYYVAVKKQSKGKGKSSSLK